MMMNVRTTEPEALPDATSSRTVDKVQEGCATKATFGTVGKAKQHRHRHHHRHQRVHDDVEDDDADVEFVLNQLTVEELEVAARSSYEYQTMMRERSSPLYPELSSQLTENENDTEDLVQRRRRTYARRMAVRYVTSKSDRTKALQKMKATLAFRSTYGLNDLDELTEIHNKDLCHFLHDRKAYVQGYDNNGRSSYLFVPRLVTDHGCSTMKRTLLGHVWSIEKAIACSRCDDQSINVVVDFASFSLYHHSPPYQVGKELMMTLRNHYVGHVHKIFLVNVPTTFTMLWSIFQSFAGSKTRAKIVFVDGTKDEDTTTNALTQYYTPGQATSWMMKGGLKNRVLDCEEYINQRPFDRAFDDDDSQYDHDQTES